MLAGSTSIVVGLLWDISWHMTIGRDTFWTPAHMAIYLGGVVAGPLLRPARLKTTFAGTPAERTAAVGFWGFRAPLGAWVAIWGTFAMLTSAPFDNWWHNAYGLDVKILSPPHSLLGARHDHHPDRHHADALALQNRAPAGEGRALGLAHLYSAGIVLLMATTLITELQLSQLPALRDLLQDRLRRLPVLPGLHRPLVAPPLGRPPPPPRSTCSSPARWCGSCRCSRPIRSSGRSIRRSITWWRRCFPCCSSFPALAIDFFVQRREGKRAGWQDALPIAVSFLGLFLAAQWFFSAFMLSSGAQNWFFAGDRIWEYTSRPGPWRHSFLWLNTDPLTLRAMGVALVLAVLSSGLGLLRGAGLAKVQR